MENAIKAVIESNSGCKTDADQFGVPRATLQRRIEKYRQTRNIQFASPKEMGHYKTVSSNEQELELVKYIQDMEARLFGLSPADLRIPAYQLAQRNNLPYHFNGVTEMAGEDWFAGFLKRHVNLSLRKPEATVATRAMGFNLVSVNKFVT
ncbi:hypothetical protein JTB14_022089 [Gonioctena quinquepunctata]|nr:hypothetical protein JTB14_022089 [Gonioctena quinquepunctata]